MQPLFFRARLGGWASLLVISGLLVVLLETLRLPAALLLGPMIAAIIMAAGNRAVPVSVSITLAAQGVIGCLMAKAIPLDLLMEIGRAWPIFLAGVVSVIAVSVGFGWLLARMQVLPGSTAIWGSVPGAASAMTIMSESFGADMRLVAIMQYMRVLCVALAAALVSRFYVGASGSVQQVVWFPPVDWTGFTQTLLLIAISAIVVRLLRIPGGMMLVPMVLGALLQDLGIMQIVLPPWLLAISYAIVGWGIGGRFTRAILAYALKALPRVIAAILALIAICGGFAYVLVRVAGVDPLTAYLATSPGGADTVAIISASSDVDVSFVMAMQLARFLCILVTGPALARLVVKWSGMDRPAGPA